MSRTQSNESPSGSTAHSAVRCKGCGAALPVHQLPFLGHPEFNLWAREGYCSYPCFREHASQELVDQHDAVERDRFRDVGEVPAVRPSEAPGRKRRKAPPPSATGVQEVRVAGVLPRVLARFLDGWIPRILLLAGIPAGLEALEPGDVGWIQAPGDLGWLKGHPFVRDVGNGIAVYLLGMVSFFAACQWLAGATPFKALLGLRVATERGAPASLGRNLVREALYIFDVLLLGLIAFVCMSMSDQNQRLGDMIGRTLVVRDERGRWIVALTALGASVLWLAAWSGLVYLLWF